VLTPTPSLRPRTGRFTRPATIDPAELDHPTIWTVLKLIWNSLHYLFHSPPGMIMGSAFLALMLWGQHGKVPLLGKLWDGWCPMCTPPRGGHILPGIMWDQELASYLIGVVLVVVAPCILIRVAYRQRLSDYGLGLPKAGQWRLTLVSSALLFFASAIPFYFASRDAEMRATYPLYRGAFQGAGDFLLYELGYLAFFIVIEFVFRGYLLFGLFHAADRDAPIAAPATGVPGRLLFGYYAILISMLSYTAWHLGKPTAELFSTLLWGIAAGTVALATGSIWSLILVHWLLNVGLDYLLWRGL
jgi:hypothetical protein